MLNVDKVSCGYDGTDVVFDVSLAVEAGQSLCLIGPNGCGKTTLLRTIAGLLDFSGDVTLDGRSIRHMKRKDIATKIAYMGQFSSIYFSYSVYDTVMMGRYSHMKSGAFAQPSDTDRQMVEDCLKKTGISDIAKRQIDTLSGGQLQRVFLAKTVAQDPDIILLDEPTNHLDLKHQIELVEYLRNWCLTEKRTVIGVMHDLNLAMRLSDHVALLSEGRLQRLGNWSDMLADDILSQVYETDIKGYMAQSYQNWVQHI